MQRILLTTSTLVVGALVLGGCSTTAQDAATAGSASTSTSEAEGTTTDATTAPGSTSSHGAETGGTAAASTAETTPGETTATSTSDTGEGESSSGHGDTVVMTSEPAPTCDDAVKNQDESDVDCGGTLCPGCDDGSVCALDGDCANNSCIGLVCTPPTCDDGLTDQDETDVDCGGATCSACADNLACQAPEDCVSGVCTDGLCVPPSCADGVQNQDESDVDCGGVTCDGCLGDLACATDDDCLSGTCTAGLCEPVDCLIDSDCDDLDGACTSGECDPMTFTCTAVPGNEGADCDDDNPCVGATTCQAGVCGGGTPKDCSAMSDACHVGSCVMDTGECESTAKDDGTKCEDGNACTKQETCSSGVCGGSLGALFTESFTTKDTGWTLDPQWAIGPTAVSVGCSGGQDPALDHSSTDDNGVAGVVLGGCIPDKVIHDYYCLTSPPIDTTLAAADVHLSFWRWLNSDYTPYMKNKIEVWNGNAWTIVFETAGSPAIHDVAWKFLSHDVTAYKNPAFQARWCFNLGSTAVFLVGGWNIDDVTVGPAACMP